MKTQKNGNKTKKKKVFIVDDHAILREGLSHLINSEEDLVVCGETDNISNALQAIGDSKPDIAIVDITLEDGSGIRLIEDLKYSIPGLPVSWRTSPLSEVANTANTFSRRSRLT